MKNLFAIIALVTFSSCAQSQSSSNLKIPLGSKVKSANEAMAVFGEGCFWHAEIVFQSLAGVRDAVSGYAGGTVAKPDYETVCTGSTGHAEVVQVFYDTTKISYETLVKAFFASMDPTELNRQGNDEGTQYRSVAFYQNDREKQIIDAEIKRITDSKKYSHKIVTQVLPYKTFYAAEDYHQEYIYHHPENGYVQNVSIPDYLEFRKEFKGNFKK
ncbi:peptide-methionine (S)-S-oxide reductase MsrA [Ferruginibacter sp. SUN106]|uniref:peptide-methionine (S)-S-oxide reductase MsrA n=1 Tax=Ferruginibacter sp. SUN106 TaxID=2978348 RepID=UPI003D362D7F